MKKQDSLSAIIFLGFIAVACGERETASPRTNTTSLHGPLTQELTYYNHFAFNHVYTIPLTLGGQSIEAVLDTGSSNLLAIGDASLCDNCKNEYGYDSTYSLSSNAQKLADTWQMSFLPIGQASVQAYSDTLSFGGLTVPDFNFGLVTSEVGIPNIWGIAYAGVAKPSGNRQTPVFDALLALNNSWKNEFSLRLCGVYGASQVTLGGYESTASTQTIKWTPIVTKKHYQINVSSVTMSSATAGADKAGSHWEWKPAASDYIIVDSGTNPLVFPPEQISPIVNVLKKVASDNKILLEDSFWPTASDKGGLAKLTAAEIAKFPPITMELPDFDKGKGTQNTTFTLSISPETYIQKTENGSYLLGIEPGESVCILGTVFMENYVILHERGTVGSLSSGDDTAKLGFYSSTSLCNAGGER